MAGSSFTYVMASLGQLPAFFVTANMVRSAQTCDWHIASACDFQTKSCKRGVSSTVKESLGVYIGTLYLHCER